MKIKSALVDRKGGFSASAVYTNVGTMCITSSAVLKIQRIQLEQEAVNERLKIVKKSATQDKRLEDAQRVKVNHISGEKFLNLDLKQVIVYFFPVAKCSKVPPS